MRHTTLLLRTLALCGCLVACAVAQRDERRADPVPGYLGNEREAQSSKLVARSSPQYQGPGDCERCHVRPQGVDDRNGTTKYFEMTEFATWEKLDKHALAGAVLKNRRSATMLKLLREADPKASADDCLSCHAACVNPSEVAGGNRDDLQAKGVSCEICHGAATAWLDIHWHLEKWRNNVDMTPKAKWAVGFVDLRDDVTRAKVCLSCHLGNPKEEVLEGNVTLPHRVVTHEMFAAGHPPVSGFEMETFAKAMPYHWTGKMPPQYAKYYGADRPGRLRSTRAMVLAALVALRQYARLVGDDAARRPAVDLAAYDCAACHHELTTASWRQARGYGGRAPGRPAVRSWPLALGIVASAACAEKGRAPLGTSGRLARAIGKFRNAVAAKPFGEGIEQAARDLEKEIATAIDDIDKQPFDQRRGLDFMRAIAENGASEPCDFETARQIAWCLRTVYSEIAKQMHDASVDAILAAMAGKEELALDLPSRADESSGTPSVGAADCTCVVNRSVPEALAAAAKYDVAPSRFQDQCRALVKALQPPLK